MANLGLVNDKFGAADMSSVYMLAHKREAEAGTENTEYQHPGSRVAAFSENYTAAFRLGVRIKGITVYAFPVDMHEDRRRLSSPYLDRRCLSIVSEYQPTYRPREGDLVAMLGRTAYRDAIVFREAFVIAAMDLASHATRLIDSKIPDLHWANDIFMEFVIACIFIRRGEVNGVFTRRECRQAIHEMAAIAIHEVLSCENGMLRYDYVPAEQIRMSSKTRYLVRLLTCLEKTLARVSPHSSWDHDLGGIEDAAQQSIFSAMRILDSKGCC